MIRVSTQAGAENVELPTSPAPDSVEWDEIRLGRDDRAFFISCPGGNAARMSRAGVLFYFAWGCFRDFCPGPAVHRRRDAMPGPGHEIVSVSRLRAIDATPTHHAPGATKADKLSVQPNRNVDILKSLRVESGDF